MCKSIDTDTPNLSSKEDCACKVQLKEKIKRLSSENKTLKHNVAELQAQVYALYARIGQLTDQK